MTKMLGIKDDKEQHLEIVDTELTGWSHPLESDDGRYAWSYTFERTP
jgi:hypothetical protein